MAKAKIVEGNEEIKKLVASPKAIIGTQKTLKQMRAGKVSRVFLSKNVDENTRKDIQAYSTVGKVSVIQLTLANNELGTLCKKPYSISVLGELK